MVRPLCKAGAVVVIVGYDLAPNGCNIVESGVKHYKP
jgi:hypothetical protein